MKILMAMIMTMVMTSAFAGECKLNAECKVDADCKNLNKDYAVVGGKCINPAAKESETQCANIATDGRAAKPTDSGATVGEKGAVNAPK